MRKLQDLKLGTKFVCPGVGEGTLVELDKMAATVRWKLENQAVEFETASGEVVSFKRPARTELVSLATEVEVA